MNAEAVNSLFVALNSGELDRLDGVLTGDFVFEEVAGAGAASRDALKEELRMLLSGIPDLAFRPVRVERAEGRVYLEFRAMGMHRGALLNVPPTDAFVILSGVFNVALEGTRLSRLRLTIDFAGLRRQLLQATRRR